MEDNQKIQKIYMIQDIANYGRTVDNLPSGNIVKFNGFDAEVNEEDVGYFQRMDDFVVKGYREVYIVKLTEEMLSVSPARVILELHGLMYGGSGFAEAMRNVVLSLYKEGFIIVAHPVDQLNADGLQLESSRAGTILKKLSHIRYDFSELKTPVKHLSIEMTVPDGVKRKNNMYNIGYVMFETQEWPLKFTQHLDINVDELWVPSQFNVNNVKDSGWKKPIHRMPLGVNVKRFDPEKVNPFRKGESPIANYKDKFIFLTVMGYSARKGIYQLYEAYLKEFKKNEKVVLYIKAAWFPLEKAQVDVDTAIQQFNSHDTPEIVLDFQIYRDKDHPRLYKSANAFVLPSYGEGWSLTHTEAMSMALPTIGTKATSMVDFMNESNSYSVKVGRYGTDDRCNWITPLYVNAIFSIPDVDDLRRQMRNIFDNQKRAKEIGGKARQDMETKWTWDNAAKLQTERIKEIVKNL